MLRLPLFWLVNPLWTLLCYQILISFANLPSNVKITEDPHSTDSSTGGSGNDENEIDKIDSMNYVKSDFPEIPDADDLEQDRICANYSRGDAASSISEGHIFRMLMGPGTNFSKTNRPVKDARKSVMVKVGLRLLGIQDFVKKPKKISSLI